MVHVRTSTENATSSFFLDSFCVFMLPALNKLGRILITACECIRLESVRPFVKALVLKLMDSSL